MIIDLLRRLFKKKQPLEFSCGAFKDVEDDRDYIKEIEQGIDPKSINLLDGVNFKATWQSSTNACTGHAMSALLTILYAKLNKTDPLLFNYYYIYYWSRMLAFGSIKEDKGSFLRQTMMAVQKYGALIQEMCTLRSVYSQPKQEEISSASLLKIKSYFRLPTNKIYDAVLYTLIKERLPILAAMYVRNNEWNIAGKTGVLKPCGSENRSGGHAICLYGYDQSDDTILATNSWGELWGNKGFFKITRASLERDIMDAWTVGYNYY